MIDSEIAKSFIDDVEAVKDLLPMTDKEIVDKLIELTEGTIDHLDLEDAIDLLCEIKTILSKRK